MEKGEKVSYSMASICSKLKRLKLQEQLLLKNISSNLPHEFMEDFEPNLFVQNARESKTEKSLKEMWILFSDLKSRTQSENLDDSDMIELKSDILALDTKIKNVKASLQTDLSNVMENEKQILIMMHEGIQPDDAEKKVRVQSFDNIVPSPVKIYRETPMKHDAVKEFDDFMQKHKKYDGWFEYNHNIFANLWEKYFGNIETKAEEDAAEIQYILKSNRFQKFYKELDTKVQGVFLCENDVIEHTKWYIQFSILKKQKKEAIANWQAKRNAYQRNFTNDLNNGTKNKDFKLVCKSGMSSDRTIQVPATNNTDNDVSKSRSEISNTKFSRNYLQRIQRPTKQWLSKCNVKDDDISFGSISEVDNLPKMKEPQWRASLKNIS